MARGDKDKYSDKQKRKDSASKAVATKLGIPGDKSNTSETKESLLKKARVQNVAGRSSMSKQELINALETA